MRSKREKTTKSLFPSAPPSVPKGCPTLLPNRGFRTARKKFRAFSEKVGVLTETSSEPTNAVNSAPLYVSIVGTVL